MRRPNFIIVGAPKCGTTALSEYLRSHPGVFITTPKELHYFADDFPGMQTVTTETGYLNAFADAEPCCQALGEASPVYLYSRRAISRIHAFDSAMRLIVMLRNPIDMVYSWHGQRLFAADENEPDFERAWRLQTERRQGRRLPPKCRHVELIMYREFGMLGEQVHRLCEVFPKNQVKFVFLDDLRFAARAVYSDVLAFLDVPDDGRTEFPTVNESHRHRFQALGAFIQQPPKPLANAARLIRRALGMRQRGLLDSIRKLNVKREARPPLTHAFRQELADTFRADVTRLSQLLGRDLSHWTEMAANDASSPDADRE